MWEYKTVFNADDAELNSLGRDGWEMLSKIHHPEVQRNENNTFYFKPERYEFTFKRPSQQTSNLADAAGVTRHFRATLD